MRLFLHSRSIKSPRLYIGCQESAKAVEEGRNDTGITHVFDCRGNNMRGTHTGKGEDKGNGKDEDKGKGKGEDKGKGKSERGRARTRGRTAPPITHFLDATGKGEDKGKGKGEDKGKGKGGRGSGGC